VGRKGKKMGAKAFIPHHRGRRGNFWGDPANGHPGSQLSRRAIAGQLRTIERRTRREGEKEIQDQLEEEEGDAI
jgi:hypothetical protein